MNIVEIKVTQVTLPDGTRAWFESRETAEAVGNLVDTVVKIGCDLGGKKVKPAKVKVEAKTFPLKDAKLDAKNVVKPKRESGRHKGNVYAEKTCGVCEKLFTPKSGRQKICDDCKKAGWKTCPSKDEPIEKKKKEAKQTPPKDEKEAKEQVKKSGYQPKKCAACGNDFVPKSGRQQVCEECREKGVKPSSVSGGNADGEPSDALAEIRKLADAAGLTRYKKV